MATELNKNLEHWDKAILLMDMDAFFASVEQMDFPELQGKPIAIINSEQGTAIITRSYEARAYGIKTGMRLPEAKQLCPNLITMVSRSQRYADLSRTIMAALRDNISPEIEVFSIDEAFLDITRSQSLLGNPHEIAQKAKKLVYSVSGCTCSVGVAVNKAIAKFAAKQNKPNGVCVIGANEAKERLANVPVTELCGIGKGIANFLSKYNVYTCGELASLPVSVMGKRFGNIGRRLWLNSQGLDLEYLKIEIEPPKSVGHGKIISQKEPDREKVKTYLVYMAEKVAERLRRYEMAADSFFIGILVRQWGWLGGKYCLPKTSNDPRDINKLIRQMLIENWQELPVYQVQVTALNPISQNKQADLFMDDDISATKRNVTIDAINDKYGRHTIRSGNSVKDKMQEVIAPAWRPDGIKKNV